MKNNNTSFHYDMCKAEIIIYNFCAFFVTNMKKFVRSFAKYCSMFSRVRKTMLMVSSSETIAYHLYHGKTTPISKFSVLGLRDIIGSVFLVNNTKLS